MINVAQKLRFIRELYNYTQEYIAMELGISQTSYCKIESGQTRLTLERLEKLASIFQLQVSELLSQDDSIIIQKWRESWGKAQKKNETSVQLESINQSESESNQQELFQLVRHLETEVSFLRDMLKQRHALA